MFSAYDPHQETQDKQRRKFQLLHDVSRTVQTIRCPFLLYLLAGGSATAPVGE